ncbi:hypothetical protein GCM10022234_10350 [Aeromicrobium panaciterrae]|uniref:hypothetical protein n=1 Tax=Aeromicrobium panaciterrae TaxID=363861 RepID=UPI0031E023D9
MTLQIRPFAALAIVALLAAGCSGSSGGSDAGGTGTDTYQASVKFAECMRDNGVPEFPDPGADGELTLDSVANGSSIDTDGAAWKTATAACKDLEPAGFTGHKRSAAQQVEALKFAQCIRENGVEDFPDPGPDDPMVDTNKIPSANESGGMTILNAAMDTCGKLAEKAGAGK